jgi:hypothetical protein
MIEVVLLEDARDKLTAYFETLEEFIESFDDVVEDEYNHKRPPFIQVVYEFSDGDGGQCKTTVDYEGEVKHELIDCSYMDRVGIEEFSNVFYHLQLAHDFCIESDCDLDQMKEYWMG